MDLHLDVRCCPSARGFTIQTGRLLQKGPIFPRKKFKLLEAELRLSFMEASRQRPLESAVLVLQALESVAGLEHESARRQGLTVETRAAPPEARAWDAREISSFRTILENPRGLDSATIADTASEMLGVGPREIHAAIPPQWRVVHIESVLRPDLAARFGRYQQWLRQDLEFCSDLRRKLPPHSRLAGRALAALKHDEIVDDMVLPRLTFHGTKLANVSSIVKHGFKLPGILVDGRVVASPRTGVVYPGGVYSSQDAGYAMSYASGQSQQTPLGEIPSMRLFVCATVMGRTLSGASGPRSTAVHGPLREGYDSHFDGGFEYIIHDERAMLPCYVVHLDLGSDAAKEALKEIQADPAAGRQAREKAHPRLAPTNASPGDVRRERAARKAAAEKWFPYGFGAAKGTAFVVEEVGAASDDEEEYGEWQKDKHAFVPRDFEEPDDADESGERSDGYYLDQYQGAVRARR